MVGVGVLHVRGGALGRVEGEERSAVGVEGGEEERGGLQPARLEHRPPERGGAPCACLVPPDQAGRSRRSRRRPNPGALTMPRTALKNNRGRTLAAAVTRRTDSGLCP